MGQQQSPAVIPATIGSNRPVVNPNLAARLFGGGDIGPPIDMIAAQQGVVDEGQLAQMHELAALF